MSQYKVRNWSEYNKSLENRGNIFLWVNEDTIKKMETEEGFAFYRCPSAVL